MFCSSSWRSNILFSTARTLRPAFKVSQTHIQLHNDNKKSAFGQQQQNHVLFDGFATAILGHVRKFLLKSKPKWLNTQPWIEKMSQNVHADQRLGDCGSESVCDGLQGLKSFKKPCSVDALEQQSLHVADSNVVRLLLQAEAAMRDGAFVFSSLLISR